MSASGGGPAPLPLDPVASPTSPSTSSMHSQASSMQATRIQSRSVTVVGIENAPRSNRFSLQFPVQPARTASPTRAPSPVRSTAPVQSVQPEALASPTGPTDTSFLTALATQERTVLELKEELQHAEADLLKLKKQWANHEAQKKRNDARKVTKLQPLKTAFPSVEKEYEDGPSAWMQLEIERRKQLYSSARPSSRTVFSGSRHTRALSLLSPERSNMSPAAHHPLRLDSLPDERRSEEQPVKPSRPQFVSRASTTPDLTTQVVRHAEAEIDLRDKGMDREVLINTGKKMATDFKDGLWTFIEDLRQATVGDEATQIHPPQRSNSTHTQNVRKQGSRQNLRPSSKGSTTSRSSNEIKHGKTLSTTTIRDPASPSRKHVPPLVETEPSFWTLHGLLEPDATPAAVKKSPKHVKSPSKASIMSKTDSDVGWDTWDSPQPDHSDSCLSSQSNTIPNSVADSSARTSVSLGRESSTEAKKDAIPWPSLMKLGPATLRRTASHLMSEWERSLTPSPGKEKNGRRDYLGAAAEAATSTPIAKSG